MDENIFRQDAKQMVDLAFNNKLFKEKITRDDMIGFEGLINYLLQSKYESYIRAEALFKSLENSQNNINKDKMAMNTVDKIFDEIHDIYESWEGGQILLDKLIKEKIKEAISRAIN